MSENNHEEDRAYLTTGCDHTSALWSNNNLWLPEDEFEIKYIRVNLVFLHKDDGTGNFESGNPEHDSLITAIVNRANNDYSQLINFQDTDCHIDDNLFKSHAKIQIVPNILHYNSTNYWNNENKPVRPTEWQGNYLDSLDTYLNDNNLISKGITVYFTETKSYYDSLIVNQMFIPHGPPIHFGSAEYPSTSNLNKPMRIHMPDAYSKYYWMKNCCPAIYNELWYPVVRSWFIITAGNLLAHEIGHCLGLQHITNCHHNLMYTYPGGGDYEASLSPSQLCIIHKNLSLSNIRKFTTDPSYISTPYIINNNTLWDLDFTSYRDVVIKNGGILTITCNLVMKSSAIIVVEPGGKLIVDGGTITTEDSSQWQGIQIWGDVTAPQTATNGVYQQGYVELKNGATIKNAVCALALWKPNDYTKTGGIVIADNANFINNAKSVHATNYVYVSNNLEAKYKASFTRCNFEINDEYLGTETFIKHVLLCNVKGVDFLGCSFSVDNTASNVSYYSIGLQLTDAQATVSYYCNENIMPCPNAVPSTFNGFYSALYATHTSYTQRPFEVADSEFYNNVNGIYAENTGYAQIYGNTFNVPSKNICTYGVYIEGISSIAIESNDFIGPGQGYYNCGILVKNSPYDNSISKNSFTNLTFGNESVGKNYDIIEVRPTRTIGLKYSCNTNSDNLTADFYIHDAGGNSDGLMNQGKQSLSAGNTFSSDVYHIYNTARTFTYYYDTLYPNRKPVIVSYSIVRTKTNNANSCNSGGGGIVNKSHISDYRDAEDNCNRIIAALESENNPDIIEALEAEYNNAEHQRLTIIGNAVREILMDSISNINDVRQWLYKANTPSADRAICATYLSQGDYETAINKAVAMINDYQMQGDALIEQTEYIGILRLQQKVESDGRVMQQLNNDELNQIERLYDNGTGIARSIAKAILEMNGYMFECDCENELVTRGGKSPKEDATSETAEAEEYFFTVSPVPAKDYIIINYNLPTDHASLTITNSLGVAVKTITIEGRQGKKVVSLSEMIPGVYSCTVKSEGFMRTEKIVLTK